MSISDRPFGLVFAAYMAAVGVAVIAGFTALHFALGTAGPPLWVAIGIPAVTVAPIIAVLWLLDHYSDDPWTGRKRKSDAQNGASQ